MKKCIYMHKFPNNMIYIGQTCNTENRWNANGSSYNQKMMKEAINKYGWENIEHIILEDNIDEKDADDRENYYIGKYKSYKNDIGYNTIYNGKYYPKFEYKTNKGRKFNIPKKIIKEYYFDDEICKELDKIVEKLNVTETSFIEMAIIEKIARIQAKNEQDNKLV